MSFRRRIALLTGAAVAVAIVLASTLAGPAMAQEVIYNPGYCAQFYPNANCQNKGPDSVYAGDYQLCVPRFVELMRGGPVPVRWAASTMSAAAAVVTPATDWRQAASNRGAIRPAAIPWRFPFP